MCKTAWTHRWSLLLLVLLALPVAGAMADSAMEQAEERIEALDQDDDEAVEDELAAVEERDLAPETAEVLSRLATADRRELQAAMEDIAGLQDADALPTLFALQDRRLYYTEDGTLIIEDPQDGSLREMATGRERADLSTGDLAQPRLTNVVRRTLRPTIGALQIFSDDPQARLAAADELAERPRPEMREAITEALERETSAETERLLNIALAQLDLDSDDDARRLEAVQIIAEVRANRLRSDLEALTRMDDDGNYLEPVAEIREAAAAGVEAIDRRARFAGFASDFVYGMSMGSVLLLAAMGLAIVFGLMGVINMAHGELLMVGAYTTFMTQTFFALFAPQWFQYYLIAAVPLAFVVTAGVGILMERGVIRFLYNRPLETLLATWGISLILIQTVRWMFGAQNVAVASPPWFSGSVQIMQGVTLSTSRVGVILFAIFVVALVWFLMNRTRLGLEVRAVMQNRDMAAALGVPAKRVDMWTFAVGAGVAGLGGVALSQIVNVGPEMGQNYIVDSFMVVVLGGVGNLLGPVFSALGIGVTTKFLEPATGAVLATILVFAAIILFIQWRPQGIFALKGRSADD
ncbi:urea ABC transporter permease subunit UrtB [Aquisalimonas asiatica]|uniref:Amino acid/amide ABC transporter membrane protein 1, HAAT family n=1 Tax=Aquisalimonas asiatica TaxID=406100 RepID=A0A1H8V9L8_9GAMM|nr:urea ABC transporter permease subunit UrtB [Aquisalimonas asiatica]SEP11518.1 amino acid/amide ABC transporter membrane protein 1, HAAT family [Aquisalimonas asiatica]